MDNKNTLPADILWVSDTNYCEGYQVKDHAHISYYHMFYVQKGTCTAGINGVVHTLTPGSIMLAAPEDVHCVHRIPAGEELRFWEIKFIINSPFLRKASKNMAPVFMADSYEKEILTDIVENSCTTPQNVNVSANQFNLCALLYHIFNKADENHGNDSGSYYLRGIDVSNFSRATIETVCYIEKNYMHECSLEQIGSAIGYAKNYLSNAVKKDLSIPVSEVISFIRIQKAADLLYYSDYNMQQVYTQTGFKNLSHFARTFKKLVGIPPAQYRRSFPDNIFENADGVWNSDDAVPMWNNRRLKDYIESKGY